MIREKQLSDIPSGKRALLVGIVVASLALGVIVASGSVAAQDSDEPPAVPASYYGSVTIDGDPAPSGTNVTVVVDGEQEDSIQTESDGSFGGSSASAEKLVVGHDDASESPSVRFLVNGELVGTVQWQSGANQEVDLTLSTTGNSGDDSNADSGSGSSVGDIDVNPSGPNSGPVTTTTPTTTTASPTTEDGAEGGTGTDETTTTQPTSDDTATQSTDDEPETPTVAEPATPAEEPADDDGDEATTTTSSEGPGFTSLMAAVAIACGAYLFRRRSGKQGR
ncbi:hypothetical protein ACOZ4N_00015 (plasmid) [Halorientalis pallida]|uniref:hypothetical protein n=1 Tax=Halorientalis pallida TaxID=2479928 RepID=UPI003C6EDC4F